MNDDASLDLRARRRLGTRQDIHRAALELFEEQGVRETTVQQIAERAGVSPRTFFRHFSAKEQAGLPGHHRLFGVIDELEFEGEDPAAALRAVETAAEAVLGRANDPELEEHRRVARLLAREPELQALAASQEQELTAHLRARLTERLGDRDPLTALLVAEVAVAVWRTCWQRWGELAAAGGEAEPAEVYRRCREELRRVTS
ncbi:TetR/AcrR family transcriptional regulator [Nocardiopsis algeriensis]|uniref:AcrR family transcriptional regulator n=1 Tax=Nocardiopsis algeriensis TaxID=1478215 RepID=A0A841IUB7_9ACTN|nr:TetR/AcrR family transcriptional regulator [Nocardiopsis algeriensis]MBB6120846.1 AcrR family transcriptional regulator [Nocardiopsis algeriensis]